MVRVPTYANYMRLLNTSMQTKSMVNMYSYQATTGIKYANYAGYGMNASNIVNMEASMSVTQNFMDNNVILNTTISAMSTVMETVEDSVSSFKSQLNTSLSALSDLKNGEPMSTVVAASVSELQTVAFAGMSLLSDALNTSIAGKYIFGAGASYAPTQFNFDTVDAFQQYYDGVSVKYPSSANASLSSRVVDATTAGDLTIKQAPAPAPNPDPNAPPVTAPNNEFILSATNGFLSTAVIGGESTTGNLEFSVVDNSLKASLRGAFNTIEEGDTMIFTDGAGQTKAYIVGSVSEDGKTITFSDDTPVVDDGTFVDGIKVYNNGLDNNNPVKISTSFAIGTVVNFSGAKNVAPTMQITGINDKGELTVTADPSYFGTLPDTISADNKWSLTSESYYIGGSATETFRVSDNQSITMDISANDKVFDRLFRAFGAIAQGNLVKTDVDGNVTNADEVNKLVNDAMDLLQSAIDNNGKAIKGKNETMALVIAKISANYVTLNNVNNTLESVYKNLEDNAYSIRNVDKTEASVKMLEAQNSLEASYQILSNALNFSLLNYLD